MKRHASAAHLKLENTELRNRFALLTEHSRQMLVVLTEMRNVLAGTRTEIAALKEENTKLKEAMQTLGLPVSPEEWNSQKEPEREMRT